MLIGLLLPRVVEIRKLFWGDCVIVVQHDGAPGHRAEGIERELTEAFASCRCIFVRQPPKSPCSNILDMAVFHSMSALVAQMDYETKDELVAGVQDAWAVLKPSTLSMEWACKAITFTQFVALEGDDFTGVHTGLRKAYAKGGWAEVWNRVDEVRAGKFVVSTKKAK